MVKLKEVVFMVFWVILPICCADDEGDIILEDRWYTSGEIESFCKTGSIKKYFRAAVDKYGEYKRNLTEELRVNQILGFVCANVMIRDIQSAEYKSTEIDFRGESLSGVWRRFIHESQRDSARIIRSFLQPSQYNDWADSVCRCWPVANKHAHCDTKTVRVADQLRAGTRLNITEILQKELPRYLFTVDEMDYINLFVNATGRPAFPYFTFYRLMPTGSHGIFDKAYAAPQLRCANNKDLCAQTIRKNSKYK